jgi:hypothetical protein
MEQSVSLPRADNETFFWSACHVKELIEKKWITGMVDRPDWLPRMYLSIARCTMEDGTCTPPASSVENGKLPLEAQVILSGTDAFGSIDDRRGVDYGVADVIEVTTDEMIKECEERQAADEAWDAYCRAHDDASEPEVPPTALMTRLSTALADVQARAGKGATVPPVTSVIAALSMAYKTLTDSPDKLFLETMCSDSALYGHRRILLVLLHSDRFPVALVS